MSQTYILALDQGTTSSRAILFDHEGKPSAIAQHEFEQIYPQPGWVEHKPAEIWSSQLDAAQKVLADNDIKPDQITAIGNPQPAQTPNHLGKKTREPIYNA